MSDPDEPGSRPYQWIETEEIRDLPPSPWGLIPLFVAVIAALVWALATRGGSHV